MKLTRLLKAKAYWQIRRLIVEDDQRGQARAVYGKRFDITSLFNIHRFYLAFENEPQGRC